MADLPAEVSYFTLTGKLVRTAPDSVDAGVSPDALPIVGQITAKPEIGPRLSKGSLKGGGRVTVGSATPPLTVVIADLPFILDVNGAFSVAMVDPRDTSLSPNGWAITLDFSALEDVKIPSFTFAVPEGVSTLDISTVTPVEVTGGVVAFVNEAAASAAAAEASAVSAALSAALVGAPADVAVAAIVGNPASATRGALSSTYERVETPEAHGSVGDGVADDTAALQAALTALGTSGGVLKLARKYKVTSALTIAGPASGLGDIMNGTIEFRGDGPLQSQIISTFAGTLFTSTNQTFTKVTNLRIQGPGLATAGSRAFFFDTCGRIELDRVFVRDFEVGLAFYDCTGGVFDLLQVHHCGTGLLGGFNFDAFTFNTCDFKYCTTGLQLGWSYGPLGTGDTQKCNAHTFNDTMFAYCTSAGFKIIDKGASGIGFVGCYWEGNAKDGEIGVLGRGDLTGPYGIEFSRCLFSPTVNPPLAVGIDVYNRPSVRFWGCSTDGSNRYTVFVKMNDISGGSCVLEDCQINAVTAALQVGSRNWNTTGERQEGIRWGRRISEHLDTNVMPASPAPLKETRMYNGANRIIEAWGRTTAGAVLTNEFLMQDRNGVLAVGAGSTAAFITATSVAALPAAGIDYRGCMAYVAGNGTSTADRAYICLMSATGTYSWIESAGGTLASPADRIFIPADALTGEATYVDSVANAKWAIAKFGPAATRHAFATLSVPSAWLTFHVDLFWAVTGVGAGDVLWKSNAVSVGAGDAIGAAVTEFGNVTITAAAQNIVSVTRLAAGATAAPGKATALRMYRMGDDAADTLAVDADVLGVLLSRAT